MNQYLLLRDNKQSGPYTADQLSGMGLKAYDLVWLEGKSAAWRYPGEMEELKAFAPAVEEQPFDRFYKKPEVTQLYATEVKKDDNSRFEPTVIKPSVPSPSTGKVYINFPGTRQIRNEVIPAAITAKTTVNESFVNDIKHEHTASSVAQMPNKKKSNTTLYAAIAAAIVAVVFVSYLVISFNKQRRDIEQLNSLVKQLEQSRNQNHVMQASNNLLPASNLEHDTEEIKPVIQNEDDQANSILPVEKKQAKPAAVVKENISKEQPASSNITFKESKQPVSNPVQNADAPIEKTSINKENLFRLVSVKPNDYKVGVLGGISNLQLELTNNSLQSLHKVAIEIKYLGPEKRVIKTQTVYFENVAPGAQSTIDIPKSSRGVSIDYTVTDIKS